MSLRTTLSTLLLLLCLNHSYGLIGFDCGGRFLNATTISLLNTADCGSTTTTTNSTSVYVQLLQLSDYEYTDILQCKVKISRTVYYCGMHSHVSIVHNGRAEYLADIGYDKCLRMHRDGSLSIGVGAFIDGLKINSTTHRGVTLAGSVTNDGKCSGTQYSDPFGTWDNVVVQALAEITLKTNRATVKLDTGKVILKSGTTCDLHDGYCIDLEDGHTFWKPMPTSSCNFHQYDVLYEGFATRIQDDIMGVQSPTIYTLNTQDVTFALTKTMEQPLCGYTLLRTEHPKLFILETEKGRAFASKKPISVDNLDIFAYVNSKFVYVEKHIRSQMTSLYNNVIMQKCLLEQQVLKNALALATLLPDEFAYTMMKGPGYMAITSGEVVHVVRCIPVEVTVRHNNSCFTELPVIYRNTSMFLTPKSRILTKVGSPRECSNLLPVMYQIEDTWIKFTPTPAEAMAPQLLAPLVAPTWKYLTPQSLAVSGIYTEKDVEKLRDHIMFPAEKPALLNTFARGMAGQPLPSGSVSMYNMLDEETINRITKHTVTRVWEGFITFGSVSAGILSIFIIISLIKLVLDTAIHGYALHSVYGCSLHLLGAIWSSITHLLLHLAQRPPSKKPAEPSAPKEEESSSSPKGIIVDQPAAQSAPGLPTTETRVYSFAELSRRIGDLSSDE